MFDILIFVAVVMFLGTLTVFINIRMFQFMKNNVDVVKVFSSNDMNAAKKIEQDDRYNRILERG